MKLLSDDLRFPFSLFNETKSIGLNKRQVGDVSDQMDRGIGRPVLRIQGIVSANNFVEYDHLNLVGCFLYIQLKLIKSVATFHVEITTSADVALRLSVSTLYADDEPKCLGRSVRLPLPILPGWIVLCIDMNDIIAKYCTTGSSGPTALKSIRKIQLCSNMVVRDIVTVNNPIGSDHNKWPRELQVKSNCTESVTLATVASPELNVEILPTIPVSTISRPKHASDCHDNLENVAKGHDNMFRLSKADLLIEERKEIQSCIVSPSRDALKQLDASSQQSSRSVNDFRRRSPLQHKSPVKTPLKYDSRKQQSMPIPSMYDNYNNRGFSTPPTSNQKVKQLQIGDINASDRAMTLERVLHYDGRQAVFLYDGKMAAFACGKMIVLVDIINAMNTESVSSQLGFWRLFKSGKSPLATSILKDADSAGGKYADTSKYQQAFVRGHFNEVGIIQASANGSLMASCEVCPNGHLFLWNTHEGKRVAAFQPHAGGITLVSFSSDCSMLVTVGLDAQKRVQIIVWDIQLLLIEKNQAVGLAHSNKDMASSSYSNASKDQVITGLDGSASQVSHRPASAANANQSQHPQSVQGATIAKQLSDFPINAIEFSPYEENSLISCGRENIRFWRIKKGHLPGRPVLLNEYSRGYNFHSIAFYNDPGANPKEPRRPCAYMTSNKGVLLKIDCEKEEVVCAHQLHKSSITSFAIQLGYAVTGSSDNKLRVWPLNFSDFLMEAHHEGKVTSVDISTDGSQLLVGTSAGTLGLLQIADHTYTTILRSHTDRIHAVVKSGSSGEYVTIGRDKTIRVWDLFNAQQRFEFSSTSDEPRCVAYHPFHHIIACGFESGTLRLFDVESTSTILEKRNHRGAITQLLYMQLSGGGHTQIGNGNSQVENSKSILRLFTVGIDGHVFVYDALRSYEPLRSFSIPASIDTSLTFAFAALNDGGKVLACVGGDSIASLILIDTLELTILFRDGRWTSAPEVTQCAPMAKLLQTDDTLQHSSERLGSAKEIEHSHGEPILVSPDPAAKPSQVSSAHSASKLSNNLLGMPVKGLMFIKDMSTTFIGVCLEKYLISFPIEGDIINPSHHKRISRCAWEECAVKRLDFGKISNMQYNPCGVFVASIKSDISLKPAIPRNNPSNNPSSDHAFIPDSLAVVGVRQRPGKDVISKLSLSNPQVFMDHPGSPVGAALCLESGKAISVDSLGCIMVWKLRPDRIRKLQASAMATPEPTPIDTVGTLKVNFGKHFLDGIEESQNDSHGIIGGSVGNDEHDMLEDFESAIQRDPSMWSAGTIDEVRTKQLHANLSIEKEHPFIVENETFDGCAIATELFSPDHQLASAIEDDMEQDLIACRPVAVGETHANDFKMMFGSTTPSSPLKKIIDSPLWEESNAGPGAAWAKPEIDIRRPDILFDGTEDKENVGESDGDNSESEDDPNRQSTKKSLHLIESTLKSIQLSPSRLSSTNDEEEGVLSSTILADNLFINQQQNPYKYRNQWDLKSIDASPSYIWQSNEMVIASSNSIRVQSLSRNLSRELALPNVGVDDLGIIQEVSVSPSGLFIIAIFSNSMNQSTTIHMGLWSRASPDEDSAWKSIGALELMSTRSNDNVTISEIATTVYTAWSPECDQAIILLPLRKKILHGCEGVECLCTTIFPESLSEYNSACAFHTSSKNFFISGVTQVTSLKIIPDYQAVYLSGYQGNSEDVCGLLITCGNKQCIMSMLKNSSSNDSTRIEWMDDIGSKDIIKSIDILSYSPRSTTTADSTSVLIISLGESGLIRMTEISTAMGIRTTNAKMSGSHIAGLPQWVKFVPHPKSYAASNKKTGIENCSEVIAIGYANAIRLYSVTVKNPACGRSQRNVVNRQQPTFAVTLSFYHKFNVAINPGFVLILPKDVVHAEANFSQIALSVSLSSHIAVVNKDGDFIVIKGL